MLLSNSGCGRYKGGHAKAHSAECLHRFCINVASGRVWDYAGDAFVHRHLALPRQEAFRSETSCPLATAVLTASEAAPATPADSSGCQVCCVEAGRSLYERFSSLSADEHEQSLLCSAHARKEKSTLLSCSAVGASVTTCYSRVSSGLDEGCRPHSTLAEAEVSPKADCLKRNLDASDRLGCSGGWGLPGEGAELSGEMDGAASKAPASGGSPPAFVDGSANDTLRCSFDSTGADRCRNVDICSGAGTHFPSHESRDEEEQMLQQQLSMVLRSQLEYQRDIYETRMWIEEANLISELELLNAQTASVEERIVALQVRPEQQMLPFLFLWRLVIVE